MRFHDKVALITAAASGIGRATADIIAQEGGIVVAVDNHEERLDRTVAQLNEGRDFRVWSHDGAKTAGFLTTVEAPSPLPTGRLAAEPCVGRKAGRMSDAAVSSLIPPLLNQAA
jgi:NAD(P)-dependent dehydrogenase (short-subunit alcohol dehydrogenase family)